MSNTIQLIHNNINQIKKELYKDDDCVPVFLVSEMRGQGIILLTISHNGFYLTRKIEPGEDIRIIVEMLYNETM